MKKVPIYDQCSLSASHDTEILVERLSEYLDRNKDIVFPHRHNFYHFIIFTAGEGSYTIDFERFYVEEWQVYFMIPGQIHTWDFAGEMEGYVINFNVDTFQTFLLRPDYITSFPFLSGILDKSVFTIQVESRVLVRTIMQQLLDVTSVGDFTKSALLYFFMLLEKQLIPTENLQTSSYNYTLLKNFRALIEKRYSDLRLPKEYADLLYITPNHLNALSKTYFGIPAGEVIRNRVLLEAKRLLVLQHYSITEIAYALNFNDNSYFTKFFKKMEGITPEEFRNKYNKIS